MVRPIVPETAAERSQRKKKENAMFAYQTKSVRGYQVGGTFVLQFLTILFNNNVWYIKLALLIASLAILYFTAVVDIILAMSVISSIDQRIKYAADLLPLRLSVFPPPTADDLTDEDDEDDVKRKIMFSRAALTVIPLAWMAALVVFLITCAYRIGFTGSALCPVLPTYLSDCPKLEPVYTSAGSSVGVAAALLLCDRTFAGVISWNTEMLTLVQIGVPSIMPYTAAAAASPYLSTLRYYFLPYPSFP